MAITSINLESHNTDDKTSSTYGYYGHMYSASIHVSALTPKMLTQAPETSDQIRNNDIILDYIQKNMRM